MTLSGTHFSTTPEENLVYFDGHEAEVLSASETTLVVRPVSAYVEEPRGMSVTVITNNQASNHHWWTALPSGSLVPVEAPFMIEPTGLAVSLDDKTLYVADRMNGVLSVELDSGRTTWLRRITQGLYRPSAIAVHPITGEVYVGDNNPETLNGRIVILDPAGGGVRLAPVNGINLRGIVALTFASDGALYILRENASDIFVSKLGANGTLEHEWAIIEALSFAVDAAVLGTNLYITGTGSIIGTHPRRLVRVPLSFGAPGVITTSVSGSDFPDRLLGIVADTSTGTLLVRTANGIKRVDSTQDPIQITDHSVFSPKFMEGDSLGLQSRAPLARDGQGRLHFSNQGFLWRADDAHSINATAAPSPMRAVTGATSLDGDLVWANESEVIRCASYDGIISRLIPGEAIERLGTGLCGQVIDATPDGRLVGTHAIDSTLRVFDPATGETTTIADLSATYSHLAGASVVGERIYFSGKTMGTPVTYGTGRVGLDGADLEAEIWSLPTLRVRAFDDGVLMNTPVFIFADEDDATAELFSNPGTHMGSTGFEISPDGTVIYLDAPGNVYEYLPSGELWTLREVGAVSEPAGFIVRGKHDDYLVVRHLGVDRLIP